jgi:zinc protease
MRSVLLVVLASLVGVIAGGARVASASPASWPVAEHRLRNGLRVVLAPDPALGDVTLLLRYDVGSGDDPNGKEGLAHLVEHLEFQGSRQVPLGQHARMIEESGGGGIDGVTGFDGTEYFETVPAPALELALWLERDRMATVAESLTDASVAHERAIVADEYRLNVYDSRTALVERVLQNEVFPPWHPYHRATLDGDVGASRRDVLAFLQTWYSPANATLVLAGPFEEARAFALVEQYFADLPSTSPPVRPRLPRTWRVGDVVLDLSAPVSSRVVLACWATPARGEPGDRALDVVAEVLAGDGALLRRRLIAADKADAIGVHEHSWREGSMFRIEVALGPVDTAATAGDAIEASLAQIAQGVPGGVVERARARLEKRRALALETSSGRAHRLVDWHGGPDPWGENTYADVDAASVALAVREYLVPHARVAAVVYPHMQHMFAVASGVRVITESRTEREP